MSVLRLFSHRRGSTSVPCHPRKTPAYPSPLRAETAKNLFSDCVDFCAREIRPGGCADFTVTVCWLDGVVSGQNVSGDILRPLTEPGRFSASVTPRTLFEGILRGGIWQYDITPLDTTDALVSALTGGSCCILFDALGRALAFDVKSDKARAVGAPEIEKSVKGGKDAFVEMLRTNTALVRRRLRSPKLKILQTTVGRKSGTAVDILYMEGVADPALLPEVQRRLDAIDVDGLLSAGVLETFLADRPRSLFPQLLHTERPDRFAAELLGGRVGILADGLPVGFVLPANLSRFMCVSEDAAQNFAVGSVLTVLRWLSALISLLFPALLVAVAMYHQEMIPVKLLQSMIEAKQDVPFSVAFEVITTLLAFELLMEAGMRLPDPVGDTVSIIGALIVGQSAVDARVVSPIAVIVVATAAICGFTLPSRDLAAALRLLRLGMVILAVVLGLYGIAVGFAVLVWYLSGMESYGVAYTAPLSEGGWKAALGAILRPPLSEKKLRDGCLRTPDRRRQK